MDERRFIDPRQIPDHLFPQAVHVDDRRGTFGYAIKSHTKDNYNHVMFYIRPGVLASQSPKGFREVPIDDYMQPQYMLKFWNIDLTPEEKNKLLECIANKLKEKRSWISYDWLAIFGQAICVKWIQNPFQDDCTENVRSILRAARPGIVLPAHPSPADLNKAFANDPLFKIYGYWWND